MCSLVLFFMYVWICYDILFIRLYYFESKKKNMGLNYNTEFKVPRQVKQQKFLLDAYVLVDTVMETGPWGKSSSGIAASFFRRWLPPRERRVVLRGFRCVCLKRVRPL